MSARITDPEQLKELLGIPFTPEQTACITAPPAPQVIVAGAGSGKTTVMAARVVWLVGTGQVAPDQVLGLTFTNKAAGELAERVRKALVKAGVVDLDPDPGAAEEAAGEPGISTYHAFAGQLLKEHGLRIGLEPSARLLADATRFQLAARVLRTAPGPYPALVRPFADLVTDLLALDAELAEHLVPAERLRTYDTELLDTLDGVKLTNDTLRKVPEAARARRELLELVEEYRTEKRRRDLLDFGDQIALSAALARSGPEVGRILREQYAVVLLDEYQDTSVAQRLLLSGLFGGGTGHPVTAVGDPCQAIYGWRGASVANLDDFPAHFPHRDGSPARRYALSENRRSGGRLLDLANGLAAPLRAMHQGVEALRPAPGAERDGLVRCALLSTHAEELAWLADSIAHLVRTGTPPGEIAVLCRTAGDFAEIQGELVERDVPVEVVGLSGLLHLPEIADLVAVCEVLQDPGANAALVRLLTGPRWRIGPRDLALLGRRARALVSYGGHGDPEDDPDRRLAEAVEGVDPSEIISLADALDTFLESGGGPDDGLPFSADARVRFARLAAELRELRRSLADPLMDVLHRVLATTGLEVELSASPHALAARRRETLGNFLDVAASFAAQAGAAVDGEATLQSFLGFLRTAAQYEKGLDNALPGGENTVKVLTAHKSKGLEWDVVAVPGLVEGRFPSEQSRESWTANARVLPHALRGDADTLPEVEDWDAKGLTAFKGAMKEHQRTEELRLGYVTFTRPRSLLLGSGHWWGPTQKRRRGPSSFLKALRAHGEAGYGEVEAWAAEPEEDAENPALHEKSADQAWPLPLDPTALTRRRRAATAVLAHLTRLETASPPHAADGHGPVAEGPDPREPDPYGPDSHGAFPDGLPRRDPNAHDPVPGGPGPDASVPRSPVPVGPVPDGPDSHGVFPDGLVPRDPDPRDPDPHEPDPHEPDPHEPDPHEPDPHEPDPHEPDPHEPDSDAPVSYGLDPHRPVPSGPDPEASAPDGPAPVGPDSHGAVPYGLVPDGLAPRDPAPDAPVSYPLDPDGPDLHGPDVPDSLGLVPQRPVPGDGPAWPELSDEAGWPEPPDDPDPYPYEDEEAYPDDVPPDAPDPYDETYDAPYAPAKGDPYDASYGDERAYPHNPPPTPDGDLAPEEARLADSWDRDLDVLAGELRRARESVHEVPVPQTLTASQLLRLAADPDGFARELARPMPRPPQPAARRGTRFHAWVESRFEALPLPFLGPDELPGGADDEPEIADERELTALKEAFARTPYARRTPHRVEVPFQLTLAGRTVRGRIDAVYREPGTDDGHGYEIIDWKTGRSEADPLQLAIYRLAWAEQHGLPLSAVSAAFLYVRSGEIVRPAELPGRAELERILTGEADEVDETDEAEDVRNAFTDVEP